MKYFIYWSADLKSSKLWSSQVWTQLKESYPSNVHCAHLLLFLSGVSFQPIPYMQSYTADMTGKFCHQYWRSCRSANARNISIFQMEICLRMFKWRWIHTDLLSQQRSTSRQQSKHCSRGIKYKEDSCVVLRVSFFNMLFSRIRLILKSFRFVAIRIHAEGRNLQGLRVVHAWMKIASITRTVLEERRKLSAKTRLEKDKRLEMLSVTCIHIKWCNSFCYDYMPKNIPYIFHYSCTAIHTRIINTLD